jgi:hypothetical protein
MRNGKTSLLLVVGCLLLLCGGCAKSKYIIKGLRLPPGAEEVDFSETKGDKFSSVTSTFNYSGGWDAVVTHFDRVLAAAGYKEGTKDIGLGESASIPGMGDFDLSDTVRMYAKEGSDYVVQLTNSAEMMRQIGGAARDMDMSDLTGGGDFTLTVMYSPGASKGTY